MAITKTSKKNAPKSPTNLPPSATPGSGQPFPYAPPVYSPAAGKQALEELGPDLAAIPDAEIGNLRMDVEAATYAALGVAGFVGAPEVKARFAGLPEGDFDMACVTGLESACFATLYALAEARAAGALESEARIAPEVAAEAAELEARMQALCEYHFGDDPEIRPELDRLRPGVGHRDLANDLLGYARIYELRAAVVKADSKYYRATDAARARELAGIFIQALSAASTPRARAAFAAVRAGLDGPLAPLRGGARGRALAVPRGRDARGPVSVAVRGGAPRRRPPEEGASQRVGAGR